MYQNADIQKYQRDAAIYGLPIDLMNLLAVWLLDASDDYIV